MNHAVLLYKDTSNPENILGDWPAETKPLGESTKLPNDGKNWQLMTDQELQDHFSLHEAEKEAWNQAQEQNENQDLSQAAKDSLVQFLTDLKTSGKTTIDEAISEVTKV